MPGEDPVERRLPGPRGEPADAAEWLIGGGEAGDLVRASDWSATPLGPRNAWPQSLRTAVGIVLSGRFPMAILWGEGLLLIYNDGYKEIAGERHPVALGRSTREVWPEVWDFNRPIFERVMRQGDAVHLEDQHFRIVRDGRTQDAYFTLCYSPIRTESAAVGGTLVTLLETTDRVLAERRLRRASETARAQLVATLRSIQDEVWIVDTEGRELLVNDAVTRNLGAPPGRWADIHAALAELEAFGPDGAPRPPERAPLARSLRGEVLRGELEAVRNLATGELRWRELTSSPVLEGDGRIAGAVLVARDVTERVSGEQSLCEGERLQRMLARVGETAALSSDVGALIRSVCESIAEELGVSRCGFSLVDLEGGHISVVGDYHGEQPSLVGNRSISGFMEHWREEGLAGRPAAIGDVAAHPRTAALYEAVFAPIGLRAHLTVPLHREGRWVANFWASHHEPRSWTAGDVELMQSVARRMSELVERKKVEASLATSELRFRRLHESMRDAFVAVGMDGRILEWNGAYLDMVGYSESEIGGLTYQDLTPEKWHAMEAGLVQDQILARGFSDVYEKEYRRKDGTVFPVELRTFLIRDESSRPEQMWAIVRDITDRKRTEAALRDSEERLRMAVAAARMATWDVDLTAPGYSVKWSGEYGALFGLASVGFPGNEEDFFELVYPDDRDRVCQAFARAVADDVPYECEFRILWPDGTIHWHAACGQVMRDDDRRPLRMIGVGADCTQRKQTELAIRESEARLRAVFDHLADALYIHEPGGRLIEANPAACLSLGFGREQLLRMSVDDIDDQLTSPELRALAAGMLAEPEKPVAFETTHRRADESVFPVEVRGRLIEWEGRQTFLSLARDLSDQKRAEAELRDSEAKFRAYVEQTADAFFVTDSSGRFLEASALACESLGYSREELLQMSVFDVEQDVDLATLQAMFRDLVPGKPTTVSGHHRRKDGSVFPVEVRIGSFTRGAECSYLASVRDVTERERAEAALRESLLFRREAEKIGRIGAWKVNPATDYLYWTEGVYEILGAPHDYRPGLSEGLRFYDVDSIPILEEALRRALTDGTPFVVEAGLTTWKGEHIWTEVRGLARIDDGGQSYVMGTFLDITERRQAEQSLRDQEELLKEMGRISRVGGWEMDAQSLEGSWTEEVARIHDLDPQVAPNKELSMRCYSGDSRARLESALRDALDEGKPYDLELEFRSATGIQKWVRTIGQPVRDGDRVVKLRGTLQDITSRIEAERTLRESEERFRTLFETMAQGVVYQDATGVIISANPAAERILGLTVDEMKGRTSLDPDWKVLHEDGSDFLGEDHPAMVALRSGMAVYDVVMGIPHPAEGRYRWISVNAIPQFASGECHPHRVYTTFEDITERRRAEEEVRTLNGELERRVAERTADVRNMAAVINSSTDFIATATPDGRPLWENEAFRRLAGIRSSGPHRPETIEALHPPGSASRILHEGIPAAIRDGHWEGETEVLAGDGRAVPVSQLILAHRGDDGELAFVSTIMRDITERKRLESAIREQSHELERANAELLSSSRHKDEFLANMSHELRTPLTGILGISEGLLEDVYGPLSDGQRRSVAGVQECGRHLLSLINDILDVAKIEAGIVALEKGPVDVHSICHASARFLKDAAHKKSIGVELAIDEALATIDADERRLKQILVNLLANAVKFSGQGGRVGLQVEADAGRRQARFTVWDAGIGISPEGLRSLFKPFVQLDAGLAREQGGTGLGLVLVKRLTELHGGTLDVSSVPGEGSRFTVILPWDPAEDAQHRRGQASPGDAISQPRADDGPSSGTSGPRILIVDDNQMSVRALKDFLSFKGYVVEAAEDGEIGIARARAICPDLILMDIQMPGMDGLEAIRRLRKLPRLGETPIVALTAMAMRGDRERVLAAGATDYISKPASIRELHRRIRQLIARKDA